MNGARGEGRYRVQPLGERGSPLVEHARHLVAALCVPGMIAAGAACSSPSASTPPATAPDADLHDEAGFFDVPLQAQGSPHPGRMFYVFEVADEAPAQKPLAVFFAGGPGYPASLDLLPRGTARAMIDSAVGSSAPPHANPASWTSFANVLFVDERQTGFSYELGGAGPDGGDGGSCSFSPIDDAADAVRTVLSFLDAHRAIQGAPVILVGQSYGGTRVTLMLDLLLRYPTEAPRVDAALRGEVQAHYDAVFPDHAGTTVGPALAVTQFGRAVLLQPLLAGGLQIAAQAQLVPRDPYVGDVAASQDPYDVRQPVGWSQALDDDAAAAYDDLAGATQLLGVDPRSIPRLGPAARAGAFRLSVPESSGAALTDAALTSALGSLAPSDQYLVYPGTACPVASGTLFSGAGAGDELIANLQDGVRTFISDARYDSVIYAPAIPVVLRQVATVAVDTSPRPGVARPGWLTVTFPQKEGVAQPIDVRFPPYDDSGHFISVGEPQHLHDDVVAWIAATP